jgi:hypothetical protein
MARKRKRRKPRRRNTSSLRDHEREGKMLRPPFKRLPQLRGVPWLRDGFPDLLWLCSIISQEEGNDGMQICSRTLDAFDVVLKDHEFEGPPPVIDGRLTQFERVPGEVREEILDRLSAQGLYELAFPEEFAHGLGMYPEAPGGWLLDLWKNGSLSIDWEAAQQFLAPVIVDSAHGQDEVPTRAKFIAFARHVKTGRVHLPISMKDDLELFPKYPDGLEEDDRKKVESEVRALFGGIMALEDPEGNDGDKASVVWAKEFWRSNWRSFGCLLEDPPSPTGTSDDDVIKASEFYRSEVSSLHEDFHKAATTSDPDLYNPDRHEVLTGITLRALRAVHHAAGSPSSWSHEHGYPLLRQLVEALIVVRWLLMKDDQSLYSRFKDFGRGRLKLWKLHLQEYIESQKEVSEGLKELETFLDAEVNQDLWEEFQDVDLGGTFSGVDARKMASAVGMEQEYRFLFAPASSATHGEWSALDRYVLRRCMNPLHAWHRVPRRDFRVSIGPDLMEAALGLVEDLVKAYLVAMGSPLHAENEGAGEE